MLFVLYPRMARMVLHELEKLLESEKYNREMLSYVRDHKLRILLEAANDIVFWRDRLHSFKLDSADSLEGIPILSKAQIRAAGEGIWSKKVKRFSSYSTGGTTGTPLSVRRNLECTAISIAALWRAKLSWGLKPFDKAIYLKAFGRPPLMGRLRMALLRKRISPAFLADGEEEGRLQNQLLRFKPKGIEGYPTGLLEAMDNLPVGFSQKVPVIITTGEMIFKHQRKLLEERFDSKVYTYYGSNEIGSIAFECEFKQLHVCEEHVVLEVIDDANQLVFDEVGRVVVTDLDNYAMPLIRYELGDRAAITKKPCICGRSSMVISQLEGRNQDYLTNSKGSRLSVTQISGTLRSLASVGNIQFRQANDSVIEILYDGNSEKTIEELKEVENLIRQSLGSDQPLKFRRVPSIEKTQRGKQPLIRRSS